VKKVLIIDHGNAARSIMAEALVNHYLGHTCGVEAYSVGIEPKGQVDKETIEVLAEDGIETGRLRSKGFDELPQTDYDLVVTVCDDAKGACPTMPGVAKEIHIGFDDPAGKPIEAYERELHQMKRLLLPRIREELGC
jgi:arsenate reductase